MEPLQALRARMRGLSIDAAIVPTADPHLSEYVAGHWALREHLSGFTGSAGTLVVTASRAALLTDSRYWEQAERQIGADIELVRAEMGLEEETVLWLEAELPSGACAAADPRLFSIASFGRMEKRLSARGIRLLGGDPLPEDALFWPDRPRETASPVRPMARPADPPAEKLAKLGRSLERSGIDAMLVTALDEVAWLTNLRGADLPHTPVFRSVMLVGKEGGAKLFSETERFDAAARAHLNENGIALLPFESLEAALGVLSGTLLVDPEGVSKAFLKGIAEERLRFGNSPAELLKSRKSEAERALIREAMRRDGVALTEFYAELDQILRSGGKLTESDVADLLHAHRAKDPEFSDESFDTIAAFGANAALPHYAPERGHDARIEGNGLLLIDSGAQYAFGTTDVTRMTPVGEPTDDMKRDVAHVTAGMLRLLRARFPEGTDGAQLDAVARFEVWQGSGNYFHGTGHGVGHVLCVHEGPVGLSPSRRNVPLAVGNVLSVEPGLYRPGRWGVRVENLVETLSDADTEFGAFLRFAPLTCVPIDVRTLPEDFSMKAELNAYNREVAERLRPHLSERALAWLERAAYPL